MLKAEDDAGKPRRAFPSTKVVRRLFANSWQDAGAAYETHRRGATGDASGERDRGA